MKVQDIARIVFPLVGAGLLVGAAFTYEKRASFIAEAVRGDGVVIDLESSRSGSSSDRTYRPVVRFVTEDGERVEFTSSFGSNPPSYSRGDRVRVLYLPSRPRDAEIESFFALWGVTVILGGIGAVFLVIGVAINIVVMRNARRKEYLRQHGQPIETEFTRVELNTSLTVNGSHPYRVLSQWQNPGTGKVHVFKSDNVWFDPTSYVTGRRIKVFIERRDPRKYFVDLSFLPEVAD